MRNFVNHIWALLATIATASIVGLPVTAHAQTIQNTATVSWTIGSSQIVRNSNRVELSVERPDPARPTLSAFSLAGSGPGSPLSVPATQCQTASGPVPITLGGAFEGTKLSPANVKPATAIRAGEPLVISLYSASDNLNPAANETISVKITTAATAASPGDSETIILTETGPNTGTFVGLITTRAAPPEAVRQDCVLSLHPGDRLTIAGTHAADDSFIASTPLNVLIDPYGVVFDSGDGAPIRGTRVTLVDANTGLPAQVFGDDGVSSFPSSVVTGTRITDSGGTSYNFGSGDYRFPFARPGSYRLVVEPPSPYTVPSTSRPADLAGLLRPDGNPYAVVNGSYGDTFVLNDPAPVRIDIPADRPGGALSLVKTASSPVAVPGDAVQYRITIRNEDAARRTGNVTVTDLLPVEMRLKPGTVRIDGTKIPYTASPDGRTLTVSAPPLGGGRSVILTYILEVRPDAKPGRSMNRASARDTRGAQSAIADAFVRISRDGITDRMTIIGRITDGGCTVDPNQANGVPNVRVMLEDGSYAVTDMEGRYHFDGVIPGLHVVQIDPSSLPANQIPADCAKNARSAGSAMSRFVEGQGGALLRADFRTATGENTTRFDASTSLRPKAQSDAEAAGANREWFADQTPGIAWLFPEADHNPRTKAVRIAIKHAPGQTITLLSNGKPVQANAFDGTQKNGLETVAVSLWRGVELPTETTVFTAEVRDAEGKLVETLTRSVHFGSTPIRAELVREKSLLVADGVNRPVIALRLTDRNGKPVHHGLVGDFDVPAPYFPAVEADAQAAKGLAGLERARPVWRVEGDDGIAYIELEPTTTSGALTLTLPFRDGDVSRRQRIDAWLEPGQRSWTIVGFAAGTAGFNTLEGRLEALNDNNSHLLTDARLALYSKGRVKGKWLMTLAYDSDKSKDDSRFGSTIDPSAYYTIYADRTERRYDASSLRKLYLKLERPQFYALFGDYDTGINDPQLTRYTRAFNGAKAEFRNENVSATAFAADTPFRHRREEIQGNGLTGPYALGARDIMPNSEQISIEVRDRLQSGRVLETRALVRHIDYDIDYVAGTLRFRDPVLSRSSGLDPQFIIANYEVDGVGQRVTNAGGRASWSNDSKTLTLGATGIHNEDEQARTNMGGVDVRYTPNAQTEVRAEFAVSDSKSRAGSSGVTEGSSTAWLIEAEHHGKRVDMLAYARQQERGYGVGQTSNGQDGTLKVGADARLRVNNALTATASAWHEDYLGSAARRDAGKLLAEYRTKGMDFRAGMTLANDRLADGRVSRSTIAQLGATKRLLNNRLELDAQTEFSLGQSTESIDFPARHRFGARYAVTNDVTLLGTYEIAKSDVIDARTARIGFDVKPWAGGHIVASANQQESQDYGPRTFAAYGLSHSLPIGKAWTVDLTLDGNKTIGGGIDPARVLNAAHPVSSGGYVGSDNVLSEDFTAVTAGASYRGERWSMTGRVEYRDGQTTNRHGVTLAGLRQIGEGRAFGGSLTWFRARQAGGATTETGALAISWAHRPDDSRFAILEKFELRSDTVRNAVAGVAGPIGGAPLTISGDAASKRVINSLAVNWSPVQKREDGSYLGRSEVSLFWGSRYVFDRFGDDDLKGWSNVVGADVKFDLSKTVDLGVSASLRQNPGGRSYAWSGGPSVGLSPFNNGYISVGYNVIGFHDRDFEDSRYTRSGPYVTMRLKFDQLSLSALGLGRR